MFCSLWIKKMLSFPAVTWSEAVNSDKRKKCQDSIWGIQTPAKTTPGPEVKVLLFLQVRRQYRQRVHKEKEIATCPSESV